MSKQVMYVGMDVGATELWVSVKGVKPRMFQHTAAGIKSLYRWVVKQVPPLEGQAGDVVVHICMEATGVYSQHVALKLLGLPGLEVSIVNPACIKAYANVQLRRSKTDMLDAEVIRCFADSQKPGCPTLLLQGGFLPIQGICLYEINTVIYKQVLLINLGG